MGMTVTREYVANSPCLLLLSASPQVCIQVRARQPSSLNSELTGACSLLSPSLDLQDQVYFSNLGKDWRFSGLGQS